MVALLRLPTAFPGCIFYIETSHRKVRSTVHSGPLERTRTRVCRVPTVDSPPSDDWGRASREGTSAPVDHRSPRVNASAYSPTDAGRRRTAGSASCANRNLFNHQQGEAEPRPQALTSMRSRAPRITHPSTGGSSLPTQGTGQVLEMQESSLGPRPRRVAVSTNTPPSP